MIWMTQETRPRWPHQDMTFVRNVTATYSLLVSKLGIPSVKINNNEPSVRTYESHSRSLWSANNFSRLHRTSRFQNSPSPYFVNLLTCILVRSFVLKAVDTIGNCQRLAFTVGVSQHMHKITNLWKFELNRSSNLLDNNERKITLVTRNCVRLDGWFRDLKF